MMRRSKTIRAMLHLCESLNILYTVLLHSYFSNHTSSNARLSEGVVEQVRMRRMIFLLLLVIMVMGLVHSLHSVAMTDDDETMMTMTMNPMSPTPTLTRALALCLRSVLLLDAEDE